MSKTWLVAKHHFKNNVLKKSFIFVLLSIPFFIGIMVVSIALSNSLENNNAPLGYVDHSGLLVDPLPAPANDEEEPVEIVAFNSEDDARKALEDEQIQAYFVLPEHYLETRDAQIFYFEDPGENAWSDFFDFLQVNLAADQPVEVRQRMLSGSNVIFRTPDGSRELPNEGPTLGLVLPIIISIAFMGLILFSAGYMLEGISDEKLNRTIEVISTSLSPSQLIGGKVTGIVGISFLQLFTWIIVGAIAVFVAANVLDIGWFQNLDLRWGPVLIIAAIAIPTYIIAAALMLAIGSTVVEAQEGQAIGAIFYMLMMLPLILIVVIIENPNGPIAIALNMLPFTSLLTTSLRSIVIDIPWWQIGATILIQIILAGAAIWLAVTAYRLGMLRYGKRLKFSEIFNRSNNMDTQGGEA